MRLKGCWQPSQRRVAGRGLDLDEIGDHIEHTPLMITLRPFADSQSGVDMEAAGEAVERHGSDYAVR